MTYFLFVLGFVLLIKGADFLVDGSSSLAKRIGVSDLVIGLTIVSLGTSAPELIVNVMASVKGSADVAMGNIIGSNIANTLLILGVAAIIFPLVVQQSTTWKEIPLSFLAGAMLFLMANDVLIDRVPADFLSRIDGLVLMAFFVLFMSYIIGLAKMNKEEYDGYKKYSVGKAVVLTLLGIVGLAYGGQWVVEGAVVIAKNLGLSEALIGLTIVAVGTSLPELATSAVAAYKHNTDIAIGNVVGSNIFNIFWVLGVSAVIKPLPFKTMLNADILIYLVATLALFIFCFTKRRYHIDRAEGVIFVLGYIGYLVFLVMRG